MNGEALGLIETVGMAAAIEAADVCVKSANVKLIGYELSRGLGMVTVKIKGDVGAVKAAIEAAKISASKVNEVYTSVVIARPAKGIDSLIESKLTVGVDDENEKCEEKKQSGKEEQAAEVNLNTDNIEQNQVKEDIKSKSKEQDNLNYLQNKSKNDETHTNKLEVVDSHEKNETVDHSKKSVENEKIVSHENDEDVCNICHDPTCPRRKGQPRNLCKHYKKS